MKNVLVSIIVPTYNRTNLLVNCLKSIIKQTHKNWECIIVDDHSSDECYSLVENFCKKDERIKLYKRPDNLKKGANSCRNFGLEISKGEFVVFFDSDDLLKPNKFEKQLTLIKETNKKFVISQSEVRDTMTATMRLWGNIKTNSPFEDYIQFKATWTIGAVLLDKKYLNSLNLKFNENLAQSQEYDFYLRLLKINPDFAIDNTVLNTIVWHKESISFSKSNFYNKSKSSITVKYNLLVNNILEEDTQLFIIKDIYRIYFQSMLIKDLKTSFITGVCFLKSHFYLCLNLKKKLPKHLIYVLISFFLFGIFNKGYKFLNLKIK